MCIIKNHTPYKGRIRLKIEKCDPHYTGGGSKLNKFYFKLGPYNISSRIHIKQVKDGVSNIRDGVIKEIELKTGGKIGTHRFGPNNEYVLENYFLSTNGTAIGDIGDAWWYLKNNMGVEDKYPRGVAKKYDKHKNFVAYYGYSHRGGQLFKIGDRLFDEKYVPQKEHYDEKQWNLWLDDMNKSIEKDKKNKNELGLRWSEGGIVQFIPFKYRGSKKIETWDEALQAAINMSRYLS